jgi:hypothetical protein
LSVILVQTPPAIGFRVEIIRPSILFRFNLKYKKLNN